MPRPRGQNTFSWIKTVKPLRVAKFQYEGRKTLNIWPVMIFSNSKFTIYRTPVRVHLENALSWPDTVYYYVDVGFSANIKWIKRARCVERIIMTQNALQSVARRHFDGRDGEVADKGMAVCCSPSREAGEAYGEQFSITGAKMPHRQQSDLIYCCRGRVLIAWWCTPAQVSRPGPTCSTHTWQTGDKRRWENTGHRRDKTCQCKFTLTELVFS